MRTLLVKEEYIKATNSFVGGIILNYLVDLQEENKSFDTFSLDLKALAEVTMLDVSQATLRREIKKLIGLGFVSVEKDSKTHKYKIDKELLKNCLIKIGAIEEAKRFIKEDEILDYDGSVCKQMKIIDIKNVRETNHEQKCVNHHNNYIKNDTKSQELEEIKFYLKENIDYEHFADKNKNPDDAKMFDSIYRIMIEVLTNNAKNTRINGNNVPTEIVNSVFRKINGLLIQEVIFRLKRLNKEVRNFKNYIITTLYNTYLENEFKIHNDLYMNFGII